MFLGVNIICVLIYVLFIYLFIYLYIYLLICGGCVIKHLHQQWTGGLCKVDKN